MAHMNKETIETICKQLNFVTNNPAETWNLSWKRNDNKTGYTACHESCIGNYYITYKTATTTNVVTLRQIIDKKGGFTEPFKGEYNTKRELYNLIRAFIQGIDWFNTRYLTTISTLQNNENQLKESWNDPTKL
jgi:hypothetical protein